MCNKLKYLAVLVLIIGVMTMFLSPVTFTSQKKEKLTVYHWWAAGGEREAIQALFDLYKQTYPEIEIAPNPVPGGAGVGMKAVMKSSLIAGNPPSTFQVHPGYELKVYVDPGYMEPITWLWEQQGWKEVYPEALQELVKFDGEYYSVPLNIHRANLVWANKKIFDEVGVSIPKTIDEFFQVMDKIKKAGYTPLALGSRYKWTAAHLFESVLLSVGGPDFYEDYFKGEVSATHPTFVKALETFNRMIDYMNPNFGALTRDDQDRMVANGNAAMSVQGDWTKGLFFTLGLKPNKDYLVFPFPGSQGVYDLVVDSFGLPKNAPGRDAAIKWLKLIGTVKAQNTFNPIKGSIAARTDAPLDPYDVVSKKMAEDYKKDRLVPSAVHGSAAPDAFMSDFNDTINLFLYTRNVQQIANRLEMIAEEHGLRG